MPDAMHEQKSFEGDADSVRAAREFVRATLDERPDCREDAVLLVSELASNAVLHAVGPFVVDVDAHAETVRIGVRDRSATMPVVREPGPRSKSGRGLRIVAELSSDWGVERDGPGKTVWFTLGAAVPVR